jgi:SAM-dependent methyltransferase
VLFEDRRRAESFGGQADRYDRTRPGYPEALLDAVVGPAPVDLSVLDVGCGTGISARLMAGRGARVLGVEVDARMAELARRRGTQVEVGPFESWDPHGRRFDRVTAAQAWHWVDPVAGADKAAAVLDPGGRICLWWNVGQPPAEVVAALDAVYQRLAPGADDYSVLLGYSRFSTYHAEADGIRVCPRLSDPVVERFEWTRYYSSAEWLDQLPTHSDHASMPPDRLGPLLDEIAAALDGLGGGFEMRYTCVLISAERR